MGVWSAKAVLNSLPFWAQKKDKLPEVSNVPARPNYEMVPPSMEDRAKKRQEFGRQSIMDILARDPGPSNEPSDYLNQAEELLFKANQVKQKAGLKRLRRSMPIFKPGEVFINQIPVAMPGASNIPSNVPGPKGPGSGIFTSSAGLNNLKPGQLANIPNAGGNLGAFIQAISGKESGGNYGAVNSSSGAMGKYQIMPANIAGPGGWDKEALGRDITTQQFMNSPKLQEQIARFKLSQYYNKYGAAGAASAWYSGSPTKWKTSTGAQGAYPSIHNYVLDILNAMR